MEEDETHDERDRHEQSDTKISTKDESLLIDAKKKQTKQSLTVKIALFSFVLIAFTMALFNLSQTSKKKQAISQKHNDLTARAPSYLVQSEDDFAPRDDLSEPSEEIFRPSYLEPELKNPPSRENGASSSFLSEAERNARRSPMFVNFGSNSADRAPSVSDFENSSGDFDMDIPTPYEQQNAQKAKKDWLASRSDDYSDYVARPATFAVSPSNEIKAGTTIPIIMITAINSDLPGQIIAQTLINVRDSIFGQNILIPRGSRVIGNYDSSVTFGQSRVLIAWDRIIRPDGVSISLEKMNGVDLRGMAGMRDKVDNHYDDILKGIAVATTFDVAQKGLDALLNMIPGNAGGGDQIIIGGQAKTIADDVMKAYLEKLINQQPTLIVEEGARGNIMVNKDLIIPDWVRG